MRSTHQAPMAAACQLHVATDCQAVEPCAKTGQSGYLFHVRQVVLSLALGLAGLVAVAGGSEWPHWRGPAFNGTSDETGLPSSWSRSEGVRWQAKLDGVAASTPVVWGNHLFLSGVDDSRDALQAMCFDRTSGKRLWTHDVGHGISRDPRSTYASSSPVTDGERALFFFGSGELVAFDFAGRQLWSRNLQDDYGPFAFLWTPGTSPTLYRGMLYVQVLQRDVAVQGRGYADRPNESYLLAIDPATGKTRWRHIRPSQARAESREAFTTPIPWAEGDRSQLLVAGGDALSGHDLASGKELWRWDHWNTERTSHWRLVPSPVAGSGVALVCAPKGDPVFAIPLDRSGVLNADDAAWSTGGTRELTSDVPTPAFFQGDFFLLSDIRRSLARLDGKTGKPRWIVATPGSAKYEASALLADGKVYLIDFNGQVAVIDASDGRVLHTVAMDEPQAGEVVRASIVAAHGDLFIRTTRHLYCVGKER